MTDKKDTRFKPGNKASVGKGRPKDTALVPVAVKQYNAKLISECMSKYIGMNIAELNEIIKDPTMTVLDMFVARILATGIQKSDQARLNFIFERMVGKVKEHVDHTSSDGSMATKILTVNFIDKDDDKLS